MVIFTRKEQVLVAAVFVAAALIDSINDLRDGAPWTHIVGQLVVGGLILGVVIWVMRLRVKRVALAMEASQVRFEEMKREAEDWKSRAASLRPRVGEAIDHQLGLWQLSNAEKEVTRLVLKGLSNKEISEVRSASEQTVKQQVNAIFKKSGLSSRAQLLAFFLEDLF